MIRRSTVIATVAIVLSLLVHFLGLSYTSRIQPERPAKDAKIDAVEMGNAFEDIAEAVSEPVPPESAPVPDPPVETLPEPEPEFADTPTSEALVATADPQHVVSPDTGSAKAVQPDMIEPSEPEESGVTEPKTVEPARGHEATTAEAAVTPPVEPDTVAAAPKGKPDAGTQPIEAVAAESVLRSPIAPAPQRLAALPVPVAPALPVTPTPAPAAVPVIPVERDTIDPETPETTVEPVPENSETAKAEDESGGSDLAVTSSLRPRLPSRRPSAEPVGRLDGSTGPSDVRVAPSQLIESPLTTYQRDGIDLFGGAQPGGLGFRGSRSAGNSDTTNYAGRVLVHLNRAPAIRVSALGYARVLFQINPDGTLAWVDIIDSTGSQEIERAAKAQVRNAAPFPRPPKGASRKLAFVYRSN